MRIKTMRAIDYWIGKPICFILTVVRRLCSLLSYKKHKIKIQRILFVKLAEQGATVLADSALRRATEIVGKENVYFLVFEQNRFILDVMNVIPYENVITIPDSNFVSMLIGAVKSVTHIRRLRIDAAVDFEFFARSSAILTWLSGAAIRVGLHSFADESPYRGDLMTHRINYNPHLHTSQMFDVMVQAIDFPADDMPRLKIDLPDLNQLESRFKPDRNELNEFRKIIEEKTGKDNYSPLILLNANASDMMPLRRWPVERYEELAKRLIVKSPNLHVAFTGKTEESHIAVKIVEAVDSPRCFSMTGTMMRQLMMLYCLSDVLVTNDSGPAHFAALTDINVITLFGPETPRLYGATGANSYSIWKNIACSPCVSAYNNRNSKCKNNSCMQLISVNEVYDLVCRICRL